MKLALAIIVLIVSCKEEAFRATGGGAQTIASPTPPSITYPNRGDEMPPDVQPITVDQATLQPDYQTCVGLPLAGKVKYPARCGPNEVMTVINDGNAREMTCCPLKSKSVLSTNPAEQYQERSGTCQSDEVGVGMISPQDSKLYCTKIDTNFFKLSPPETSIYASSSSALNPAMQAIASSYNVKDCCICPERKILIGGHVPIDNVCNDQCVEILVK